VVRVNPNHTPPPLPPPLAPPTLMSSPDLVLPIFLLHMLLLW
jgi:hypothetical protein